MKKYTISTIMILAFFTIYCLLIYDSPKNSSKTPEINEDLNYFSVSVSNNIINRTKLNIETRKEEFYIYLAHDGDGMLFEEHSYEKEPQDTTMSEFIALSTHCIIGEFNNFTMINEYLWEYEFIPIEKIYGEENDDVIKVRVQHYGYGIGDGGLKPDSFIDGHKYILILERQENLLVAYPYYFFRGMFVMDIDNLGNSTWYGGNVYMSKGATKEDVITHIQVASKNVGYSESKKINFFRFEDEKTVVINSDAIFKITPQFIISQGEYDERTVYCCTVSEIIKGNLTTNDENNIYVVTLRNKLKVNSEYILPLSYVDADTFYHQASPICIFDAEDSEMETKIKEWLSEKNTAN